jgi:hypothetical protein
LYPKYRFAPDVQTVKPVATAHAIRVTPVGVYGEQDGGTKSIREDAPHG